MRAIVIPSLRATINVLGGVPCAPPPVALPRSAGCILPRIHDSRKKWSHPPTTSPTDGKTWPTNLIDIIRTIKTMPPCHPTQPNFTFDLTPKASTKNYLVLMKKYNSDLGALLKAQRNSIVDYGSEFRDVNTLWLAPKLDKDVQNPAEQIGMASQTSQ